jgi:hypothetical protein
MARCHALIAVAVAVAAGACGGGGQAPDASIDAPPDVPPGMCSPGLFFTGEIVDWDANDVDFCGVFNARVTLRSAPATTDDTNPNGRFELCVPAAAQNTVDVTPSATASQCVNVTGNYPVRGVMIASQAVINAHGTFSARAMTQARQDALFTQIGQPYSAAKAQLVVHVNGTPRAVSIQSSHAPTQRLSGGTWAAGDTGTDVLFPNVDPGPATITVAGGATGTLTVTLEANAYTYVSVVAN